MWDRQCDVHDWSNESKIIENLEKIVFLYVKKKKRAESSLESMAMLIFDVFKGHVTQMVSSIIEENNCDIIYANNLTDQF